MKAWKGFEPDLTCRGFQYAEGETYETDTASLCKSGFHACEAPLDTFAYYPPATSVYHEVELDGVSSQRESDSKVSARKIRIGASVSLAQLVQAQVEFVSERVDRSIEQTVAGRTASNTGDRSAASNTGNRSAASNTGDQSAASNTGELSAASNTGYRSAASVTGSESIAIVTGKDSRASGAEGCWIVLTERDDDWHILDVKAVQVGSTVKGQKIKPGVFYTLRGGAVVTS